MFHRDGSSTVNPRINVGIYGYTKAGKTRFLYQLLRHLKDQNCIADASPGYYKFLDRVQEEIQKFQDSSPTTKRSDEITAKIQLVNMKQPLELCVQDLCGERLTEALDKWESDSLTPDEILLPQVKNCNAFLFFFDPSYSEMAQTAEKLEEHHRLELNRAERFVKKVLEVRQNRHLPILFVLTHFDIWREDASVVSRTQRWIDELHRKLKRLYDSALSRRYPKSLADRRLIFHSISSIGREPADNRQLEKVICQLNELVLDSERYFKDIIRKPFSKAARNFGAIVAGSLVCLAIVALIFFFVRERILPSEEAATESKRLKEIQAFLERHPSGTRLPRIEEARKLNAHLSWLIEFLDRSRGEPPSPKAESNIRTAQSLLEKMVSLIGDKATGTSGASTEERLLVLEAYLSNLPDIDITGTGVDLTAVQNTYWRLQRERILGQLTAIILRRNQVGSSKIELFAELLQRLRTIEHEVDDSKVSGSQSRQRLLDEIAVAVTFCEDRHQREGYPAKFQVVSATLSSNSTFSWAWMCLTLKSPGQEALEIALKPTGGSDGKVSLEPSQESYSIMLGLGSPVTLSLSVHNSPANRWEEARKFDLTSDPGPLAVLGLPLHAPKETEFTKLLQWRENGMAITVQFSDLALVPDLLLDAIMRDGGPTS